MRAARTGAACALASAAAVLAAGCGRPPGSSASLSPLPATPAAAPTVAKPGQSPPATVVALLDHPFGSVPNQLRLLRVDGVELARTPLDGGDEAVGFGGGTAVIAGTGRLRTLDSTGEVRDAGALPDQGGDVLVTGLAVGPEGRSWVWSSTTHTAGDAITSRLWLSGASMKPRLLVSRTAAGRALVPIAWTSATPVVADEPVGIGGYILFRHGFGDSLRLDLASGGLSLLEPQQCAFNDLSPTGTVTCVSDGREGPNDGGPVTLHVVRPGAAALALALPASTGQAGAALLSPDGLRTALASSPARGTQPETVTSVILDLATSVQHHLPDGLVAAGWSQGGALVASRHDGFDGGAPGTYVVSPAGEVALLSPDADCLGVSG